MFFNTKIKWTIDSERSEIFFRIQYVLLSGVNDIAENIAHYNISQSETCVRTEEVPVSIDYNLVIFEEKNPKHFWKRETFSGLLIFKTSGENVLITLKHIANNFDECGRAAATYSLKGKLHHDDFDPGITQIDTGCIILNSELLFEGSVQLIQND